MKDAMKCAALAALASVTLAACGPVGNNARECTEIGCTDGLTLRLLADEDDFEVGTYAVSITADGEQTDCSFEIKSDCAGADICVGEEDCNAGYPLSASDPSEVTLLVGGAPADVTVVVTLDGQEIVNETTQPEYMEVQPNGEGCPPICNQATMELTLSAPLTCPPNSKTITVCAQCGPANGCMEQEEVCASVCESDEDCADEPGTYCDMTDLACRPYQCG